MGQKRCIVVDGWGQTGKLIEQCIVIVAHLHCHVYGDMYMPCLGKSAMVVPMYIPFHALGI